MALKELTEIKMKNAFKLLQLANGDGPQYFLTILQLMVGVKS